MVQGLLQQLIEMFPGFVETKRSQNLHMFRKI
jgi:hypothetical protein